MGVRGVIGILGIMGVIEEITLYPIILIIPLFFPNSNRFHYPKNHPPDSFSPTTPTIRNTKSRRIEGILGFVPKDKAEFTRSK